MTAKGTIFVAELARELGHTGRRMHLLLRHRKVRVYGPQRHPYVWLSDLKKAMPQALESGRLLRRGA